MSKKEIKFLHIELKEDIRKIVEKYCSESGIDSSGVVFAVGYISGWTHDDEKAMQQLTFLLQAYFFSGVYYAREQGSKLSYKYLTLTEREKEIANRKQAIHNPIPLFKPKPSYVG